MQGLIGKKVGMTQVFDKEGRRVAVTVVEVGPCVVVQKKTMEKDGYEAVQLGFGEHKEKGMPKAALNRFKKVGSTPRICIREFALEKGEEVKEGDAVTAAIFDGVPYVDITGTTKGRGFQGVMRRHNMRGGPMTHGGHSKRRIGSNGQNAFPARVLRGKRMPGHLGNVRVTQQNL
ncbi:MAG: 50S ribosomal protein L3, partial [Kiritimatiellae bacterium]|nr:50S ribosomal protein L3 [Kiritimatiellia bacterium]